MQHSDIAARGLVLLGCGKMGSAMLEGWLDGGLPASSVWVNDPNPSEWLQAQGIHLNADLPADPAIVLVAVKPQIMRDALPTLKALGNGATLFLSVAAGITIATFEGMLGDQTPVIRSIPNTPAAVKQGITAIIGNAQVSEARKPAIKLWVDYGEEIGVKKSSAQITVHYDPETLVGKKVMGVVNFPPRQIGPFMSEALVLGFHDDAQAIVLAVPDKDTPNGARLC